jgi:hypothetical protein
MHNANLHQQAEKQQSNEEINSCGLHKTQIVIPC